MFNVFFALGLGLTALLLAVSHWFPWPVKLHRLAAYTVGCTALLAGAAVWLLLSNQTQVWFGLLAFFAVAGITVASAYLVDAALRGRIARRVFRDE